MIPDIRPDITIVRDEFVVLPDQSPEIIIIHKNCYDHKFLSDDCKTEKPCMAFPGIIKKIDVKSFRSPVKKYIIDNTWIKILNHCVCKKTNQNFASQPNYHLHIIHNQTELNRIRGYIKLNRVNHINLF
jgi:hypothetical protein